MARSFTTLDADDLVAEAFSRIYQRTLDGGGPKGDFRPYLFTTIRNLAATWGTQRSKSIHVDDVEDFDPVESAEEPAARSLDRALTVKAYRSLPDRWQTVLWYTEVEGLDPAEVAPKLGMTANSVAALSYRAREGLRKAWLQAHVADATAEGACAWSIERLGERSRKSLTERESARLEQHLAGCAKCSSISAEVEEVGSRLAMALVPPILLGVGGGVWLAAGAGTGTAVAAGLALGGTSIWAVAASAAVVATVGIGAFTVSQVHPQQVQAQAATVASPSPAATGPAIVEKPAPKSVDPASVPTVVPTAGPSTPPSGPSAPPTTQPTTPTTTTTAADSTSTTDDSTGTTNTTSTDSTTTSTTGKKGTVTKTVDTTLDSTKKVVDSTTGLVNGVVTTILPQDGGLTGAVSGTVTGLTGTVDGLTGTLTSTVAGVTDAVTQPVDGLVSGLVGGLLGKKP